MLLLHSGAKAFVLLRRARYFSFACPKEKYPRENDTPLGACRTPVRQVREPGPGFSSGLLPARKGADIPVGSRYAACRPRLTAGLDTLEHINRFALAFYKDVAEIYDCLTRIKNVERNPVGFSLDDAPILGLLVRVWKLLKEVIKYYEQDNAEVISILERPLIEASVVATYLMTSNASVIEDYRKCSYKDRLRILRDLENGSAFFETKAGNRLSESVREKMRLENLTAQDFDTQKKNHWKIQGKSFYDIFSEVEHANLYACTYGMMSESIHGSWNESVDWCLTRNDDGTFSTYPFHHSPDIRYVTPTLRFTNNPFRLWLQRIDAYDDNFRNVLDWVDRVNAALFSTFDQKYDG